MSHGFECNEWFNFGMICALFQTRLTEVIVSYKLSK